MKIIWVSLCVTLIVASIDAQRSFNFKTSKQNQNQSKPVVSLEKKQRPMTWLRPPEERRKLSLFPKKDLKFVVTPMTVKDEETGTTSPGPNKRPIMRKFIVHDKNEKGSWSFAPRKPLMKTKIFTMRDSKQSNHKPKEEVAEESKKVNTVITDSKSRKEMNKVQINKGNLISVSQNKIIINQNKDEYESSTIKKLFTPSNIEDILSATEESHPSELNDTILIDQQEDRALHFDIEGSKGDIDDSSNIKLLEILMNNIINDTAKLNDEVNSDMDDTTKTPSHITPEITENVPQEVYIEMNKTQIIGDIDTTDKKELTNINQDKYIPSSIQILKAPEEILELSLLPNQQESSSEKSLKEGSATPLELTTHASNITHFTESPTEKFTEDLDGSITERIIFHSTFENMNIEIGLLEESDGLKTTIEPMTIQFTNTEDVSGNLEIDELMHVTEISNIFFNLSEEVKDVSNESLDDISSNSTSEEDLNEFYLKGDLSSESVSDKSSNSDETSKVHNLSVENVSNESNMAGEDISYESISDKSNLTEEASHEIANESSIDKSTNLASEEIIDDSNMAEEISNESSSDKSTNLTEEVSIDSTSSNYTDEISNESNVDRTNIGAEEISNESNMAAEEISSESAEKINNLTEEILNSEALIDISLTGEDLSEEAVTNISDEHIRSLPEPKSIAHILASRFKRSSNVIEEEVKATTVSGFKYTGHEVRPGHDLSFKNINA